MKIMNPIGFEPIETPDAKILILGSMPSVESLKQHQYYANKRNHFWPMMYLIFELPYSDNYFAHEALLKHNKIALWDTLAECKRENSSDASIHDEGANDFRLFFQTHPVIQTILFNGTKAHQLFLKHVEPSLYQGMSLIRLPSSSPAYAIPIEKKLELWQNAICGTLEI